MSSGILSLDWGQKRIGIATADSQGISVTPQQVLVRKPEPPEDAIWLMTPSESRHLQGFIDDYSIGTLILGNPINVGGTPTSGSAGAEQLKLKLEKQFELPVILINESLTSWEAEQESATWSKSKRKFYSENSDSFVAAKFIELFLAAKK